MKKIILGYIATFMIFGSCVAESKERAANQQENSAMDLQRAICAEPPEGAVSRADFKNHLSYVLKNM